MYKEVPERQIYEASIKIGGLGLAIEDCGLILHGEFVMDVAE
jgi:hypothetical protein